MAEKTKVTGYFHVHSGALSESHKAEYKSLLDDHTALAIEAPGRRRGFVDMVRAISYGTKPSEVFWRQFGGIEENDDTINQFDRLLLLSKTGKIIFSPDVLPDSAEYKGVIEAEDKLDDVNDAFYKKVTDGSLHTVSDFMKSLETYKIATRDDALSMEIREKFVANQLSSQISSWRNRNPNKPLSVLLEYGFYHLPGLNRILKNDSNIEYEVVIQKPVIPGFNEGVSFTYRMGKEPSDTLAALGIFENVVDRLLQKFTPRLDDRDQIERLYLFTKKLVSTLSLDKIVELCVNSNNSDNIRVSSSRKEIELMQKLLNLQDTVSIERRGVYTKTMENNADIVNAIQNRIAYLQKTYPMSLGAKNLV